MSVVARDVKVSVVVPVYNPGRHIEPCIDSLLAQTLPTHQLELIFVDDGSTDDTPARLDRLAAQHPHVSVIHQPNSGWSGRPRNVGTDAATGQYVQYLDQDDWLGTEALQRLHDYATTHHSDIVLGRVAGNRMAAPATVFEHSRAAVTIHDHGSTPEGDFGTGLIGSLTPHKMFRRQFLLDHAIRFPEGRRRLEDHVFVVTAYFAATTISVYADYDCYFHIFRDDRGNAGLDRLDPVGYFRDLREALDVVDANTELGPERDRLHSRWLRSEVIRRVRRPAFLRMDPEDRRALVEQMHALVVERFSAAVDVDEADLDRHVTALIRDGDLDGLVTQMAWEAGLRAGADLIGARWADGALDLEVSVTLLDADGRPLGLDHVATDGRQPVRLERDVTVFGVGPAAERQVALAPRPASWDPDAFAGRLTVSLPLAGRTGEIPAGTWEVGVRAMLGGRAYPTRLARRDPQVPLPEHRSGPDGTTGVRVRDDDRVLVDVEVVPTGTLPARGAPTALRWLPDPVLAGLRRVRRSISMSAPGRGR